MKDNKMLYTVIGIVVALLGYFGSLQISKLTEIEKEIVALKIQIVSLQSQIMTEDRVKELIETELLKHR